MPRLSKHRKMLQERALHAAKFRHGRGRSSSAHNESPHSTSSHSSARGDSPADSSVTSTNDGVQPSNLPFAPDTGSDIEMPEASERTSSAPTSASSAHKQPSKPSTSNFTVPIQIPARKRKVKSVHSDSALRLGGNGSTRALRPSSNPRPVHTSSTPRSEFANGLFFSLAEPAHALVSIKTSATLNSGQESSTNSSIILSPKILVYEALLSFLRGFCNTAISSEVGSFRTILDSYLISMGFDNIITAIVKSWECRRTLLEFSTQLGLANDPRLRAAIQADEERIVSFLVFIFDSKSQEEAVLCLEDDSAQCFLDVVQDALDKGHLLAEEHSRMARRIIRKLSESYDRLPSSLFITGVSGREEHPTFAGGYGEIFRALHDNRPVALKRMRHSLRGADLRRIRSKFCREALVWKDLDHPNILPFLGIDRDSFSSSNTLCMVSPWMANGTVISYLQKYGFANVDKLLYEIAQGLHYLHSHNVVHGDLKGANILVSADWGACLADFGLSIFSDATAASATSHRAGTVYWMAPELIDPDRFGMKFARTPASDVYAFGCVCLELYTGQRPFTNFPEPAALMKIINGERPERPSDPRAMSDSLWQRVAEFWAQEPSSRPATQIVLQKMVWPA